MLRYLATIDALTDIPNRWRFEGMLQQEWVLAHRNKTPLSLLLLDVDHFKRCNDTYGHDAGDAVLKQVAQRIMEETRPHDLSARYGGEEFVVLLPDTTISDAVKVAERIRRRIEATPMGHHVDNTQSRMTSSIGVASLYPSQEQEPSQLISLADKALYKAKRNGRNRVEQAEPPEKQP
jgi:two-component system cell cycle response regulator